MNELDPRFDRNVRLFGIEGQKKLRAVSVAVVGVGGNGTHVVQQLALLGVGKLALIDNEELSATNRNRYIGAWHIDNIPGSKKVALGARLISLIDPSILVSEVPHNFLSREAFEAVKGTDYVFGCLDGDGPRFVLNELCAVYSKPYFDLASDVPEEGIYGGRVCISWDGNGCLHCLGELDKEAVRRFLASEEQLENEASVYGVNAEALGDTGPAVVSINGVIASLAVTEFMAAVTGMRRPTRLIKYHGQNSKVTVSKDEPEPSCFYCKGIRGSREKANIERYLRH